MNEAAPTGDTGQTHRNRVDAPGRHWYSPILALPTPVIFVAAAALAVFVLWRNGAVNEIGASIRLADPLWVVAILLVYASSIVVLAVRWHTLVRMAGGRPDWTTSAEVFLTSVIVNYAAPIGLAVPTRAALTVRDLRLNPRESGAVVVWEAGLDITALILISAVWLIQGGSQLLRTVALEGGVIVVAAASLTLAVAGIVVASKSAAIRSWAAPFAQSMLFGPKRRPELTLLAIVLTAAFWGMQIGVLAMLLAIFGVTPRSSLLAGLMGLPVLIGMLSPVPGGAGVREALMAAVARLDGAPAGPVVLAAVTYRLALFVVTPVVWGLVRLARAPRKA